MAERCAVNVDIEKIRELWNATEEATRTEKARREQRVETSGDFDDLELWLNMTLFSISLRLHALAVSPKENLPSQIAELEKETTLCGEIGRYLLRVRR